MEKKHKRKSNSNLTIIAKTIYPVYNPLINKIKRNSIAHLSSFFSEYNKDNKTEYKTITQQNVIAILSKNKKMRMDIENRRVAEYLSRKFKYFKKIKDESKIGYLRLIPALKIEIVQADEIIVNIGDENNNLYIIFEGTVIIYKENKQIKKRQLSDIRYYLKNLYDKDKEKYKYMIKKNKNLDIDFDKLINDDKSYIKLNSAIYNFYYEELEEMGTYSEGFSFGEADLIKKTNRELIIKSVTNCKLIYINKFDYNRLLKTTEQKALEKKADIFKKHFPLFKSWTMEQLIQLFNYFIQEVHYSGEYIYKQNDENEYLYFIEEGTFIQYANISFSWYNEYIDYIKNLNPNLLDILLKLKYKNKNNEFISDVNNYLLEKIESIKNENKNNSKKYPFLNIDKIYMKRKKDYNQIDDELYKENSKDNFYKIKFEENEINNPEKLYRIPILYSKEPTILGIEDIFEIKNKLTTVGCVSDQVNFKKIKIIDLLNILYACKDYDYIETFIEIMIQKKAILSETIKSQITKNGKIFEDNMNDKYEKLITQQDIATNKEKNNYYLDIKKQDEAIISLKLKGWNNGLYLDNILDTNLFLIKPKNRRKIKLEEEKRCKTLNYLYNIKNFKNEKILHSTKYSFDKLNKTNQILFLKSMKNNKSKYKLINLKSVSIKNNKYIKNFFKTNVLNLDNIIKKINKENKKSKSIKFKNVDNKPKIVNNSPNNNTRNIDKKNKSNHFNQYKNYKISEEKDIEANKDNNLNENDNKDFPYLITNSIFNNDRYYNCLPSIFYK